MSRDVRHTHKQLSKAKTLHEQESLNRTITATDNHIDALVYELYGLTKDEIRGVETRQNATPDAKY